jgi:hypothetical protein
MQFDNDLAMPPLAAITDADLAPLTRAMINRELSDIDYNHRVAIAWLATEHPDRDAEFIHTWLLIEHDVTIDPDVIDAYLATIR